MEGLDVGQILFYITAGALPVLLAITLHEVAHGWVAYKLGDGTAKMLGRLTLNPFRHIDPVGTIALPIGMLVVSLLTVGQPFAFGWAKRIPVNTRFLKNIRRDMALIAIAGPLANLAMAVVWAILLGVFAKWISDPSLAIGFVTTAKIGVIFNLVLLVLNLLPVPSLDGARVLAGVAPRNVADVLERLEPYGFLILMLLLFSNVLDGVIGGAVGALYQILLSLFVH